MEQYLCKVPEVVGRFQFPTDVSTQAKFFVAMGVISMLYALAALVGYVLLNNTYTDRRIVPSVVSGSSLYRATFLQLCYILPISEWQCRGKLSETPPAPFPPRLFALLSSLPPIAAKCSRRFFKGTAFLSYSSHSHISLYVIHTNNQRPPSSSDEYATAERHLGEQ